MEDQEKQIYYCNCEIKCKGRQYISRATYFHHKPYQDRLSMYSPAMQNFLNDNPITVQPLSSHVVQYSCVHVSGPFDKNTDHTTGPPNKRTWRSEDNDNDAVGTSSPGQCTMLTDLLRTTHLLALLKAHLYSPTHCQESLRILTLILGDNQDFLGAWKTQALLAYRLRTLQIVYLETLPISIQVLLVFLLAILKIYGYRIQSILGSSKQLQNLWKCFKVLPWTIPVWGCLMRLFITSGIHLMTNLL